MIKPAICGDRGRGGLVLLEPHRVTTPRSALALGAGLAGIVVALAPVPDCQDWREAPLAGTSGDHALVMIILSHR